MRNVWKVVALVLLFGVTACGPGGPGDGAGGNQARAPGPGAEVEVAEETEPARLRSITMLVPDMTCPLCVESIRAGLEEEGVRVVDIDLKTKLVVAEFDPRSTTPEAVRAVVEDQGYHVAELRTG